VAHLRLAFGPVRSRRLGVSLGVNNVYPKTCSYSCVYCQLSKTTNLTIRRARFYDPERVVGEVEALLRSAEREGVRVDYVTFVPDGEPTLDASIGREIELLKGLGVRVAVLTNASLLWLEDVRRDLSEADLISVKVDAVSEDLWRFINRPHRELDSSRVLEGIRAFSEEFRGMIISETMVIAEKHHSYGGEAEKLSTFLSQLKRLSKAYIAIPVRPPAELWVEPPGERLIVEFYTAFAQRLGGERVELLTAPSGEVYGDTSNPAESILSTASVHPIRERDLEDFLRRSGADWGLVEELLRRGELVRVVYRGEAFYVRKLPGIEKQF